MSLLDDILDDAPAPVVTTAPQTRASAPSDMERILALPRRPVPSEETQKEMARVMTERLRRDNPNCVCAHLRPNEKNPCITELRPMQGWVLHEIQETTGALGFLNVGSGKCTAAGTEFFDVASGSRVDVSETRPTVKVSSLLETGLGVADATCFASGAKDCWKVQLADGSAITASFDHPILTQRGWVHAAQLRPEKDFVAVPRHAPSPETPVALRSREAEMLGYLYADGAFTTSTIRFTDDNPAVLDAFCSAAAELGLGTQRYASRSKATDVSLLGAKEFKEQWGLHSLSKHKRIDPRLWGMSNADVRAFLNAFLACDGHAGIRQVEVILASEGLVDDIKFLLLRIGVRSRKRYKKATLCGKVFDAWRLTVSGADAINLLDEVGDFLGSEDRCRALRATLDTKRNTNTDVVPFGAAEFLELCDEMGWPGKHEPGAVRDGSRPRTSARQFLHITTGQNVSREKFHEFCERWNYGGKYRRLVLDGIAWERVGSVSHAGVLPVYDLSVPGSHNFVANGMVIHNTLLGILAAMVVPKPRGEGELRATYLLPPQLREQLLFDYKVASQHFRTPDLVGGPGPFYGDGRPLLRVLAYSGLSGKSNFAWLANEKPHLIIADEVHALKSAGMDGMKKKSTRTDRFLKYLSSAPDTKFVCWSGSLTTRGLSDYVHLAAKALKAGSPAPLSKHAAQMWAEALDPDVFGNSHALVPLCKLGETPRQAFHRRLVETSGVVITRDASTPTEIQLLRRDPPPMPESVRLALDGDGTPQRPGIRGGQRPDGEQAESALQIAMWARQASAGVYLRWTYPHGEPEETIRAWLAARKAWNKEVRDELQHTAEGLDSPGLLKDAARRALEGYVGEKPIWHASSAREWFAIEKRVVPVPKAVIIDDWLCRDAAAWGKEHVGVIWTANSIVGRTVAKLGGFTYYGAGEEAAKAIREETGAKTIVASIPAHSVGRNLQQFSRALIVQSPPDYEQLLGRHHRPGQTADVVKVWVYVHTEELQTALDDATSYATYVQETTGAAQKLGYAVRVGL